MSFITGLFRKEKKTESVVLIDVSASSVAGAYVRYAEDEMPTLLYTRHLPIEIRANEPRERAMLRALTILGDALICEGAPVLLRATGSGTADTILVSVNAPWQTTSVRTEYFEGETSFLFTKQLVAETLKQTSFAPPGKMLADESIIGTILNGYETHDPYGKNAHRASIVILTSLIDKKVVESINVLVRKIFHTKYVISIAGSSLRYQAMRAAFSHERDALILDATELFTAIALVRRDLLVNVADIPSPTNDPAAWLAKVSFALAELAERFPLPRTIFLLAREQDSAGLREALDAAKFGTLWLSDNPPKIISVQGSHIGNMVRQATTVIPDLQILLMALYYSRRAFGYGILDAYAHT